MKRRGEENSRLFYLNQERKNEIQKYHFDLISMYLFYASFCRDASRPL